MLLVGWYLEVEALLLEEPVNISSCNGTSSDQTHPSPAGCSKMWADSVAEHVHATSSCTLQQGTLR
jgi:hypothetical protein